MKRCLSILIFLVFITASSCNYPGSPATATDQPLVILASEPATQIVLVPQPTLTATEFAELELPTATITSTPSLTLASPREQPVNCRVGPDISYAVIGALNLGSQAEVIGKNIDITWLYVRNPTDPSHNCWLSVDFINVEGNVDLLPVVGPPEIAVTDIKVSVDPSTIYVGCDQFPQNVVINARITTNGPTFVTWYWESSTGKTSGQKQVLFEEGLTKTVQEYYQVDQAGDYSIQVRTVLPNDYFGETTFKAICTP